jgi:hypothetical protein
LQLWFALQIKQCPDRCDECNKRFVFFATWTHKAAIAHIVRKSKFKSVQTHPLNRCFLCLDCHTDYDNRGSEFVTKMKIFPELKRIFKDVLLPLIPQSEYKYIPDYFLN